MWTYQKEHCIQMRRKCVEFVKGWGWFLGECMCAKLATRVGILKWFIGACRRKNATAPCSSPLYKSASQSRYPQSDWSNNELSVQRSRKYVCAERCWFGVLENVSLACACVLEFRALNVCSCLLSKVLFCYLQKFIEIYSFYRLCSC